MNGPIPFPCSRTLLANVTRHAPLLRALIRRDVASRYRGSILGVAWAMVTPLLMLTIYTLVFSVIFKARWPGAGDSKAEFALLVFLGLIVFNFLAECITRSPSAILSQPNYVKKLVFPLQVLPLVTVGTAALHAAAGLIVWMVGRQILVGPLPWTALLLPAFLVPPILLAMGAAWMLAALGVFLRDLPVFAGVLCSGLLFLSPVFYSIDATPEPLRAWLLGNPLTASIEQMRDVLYWGRLPSPGAFAAQGVLSAIAAWAGLLCFEKARGGFADVL